MHVEGDRAWRGTSKTTKRWDDGTDAGSGHTLVPSVTGPPDTTHGATMLLGWRLTAERRRTRRAGRGATLPLGLAGHEACACMSRRMWPPRPGSREGRTTGNRLSRDEVARALDAPACRAEGDAAGVPPGDYRHHHARTYTTTAGSAPPQARRTPRYLRKLATSSRISSPKARRRVRRPAYRRHLPRIGERAGRRSHEHPPEVHLLEVGRSWIPANAGDGSRPARHRGVGRAQR